MTFETTDGLSWATGWTVPFGCLHYEEGWDLQRRVLAARVAGAIPNVLLYGEHWPVVTLGRRAQGGYRPERLPSGVPVLEIERGGEATYHGPGQWVAYPRVSRPPERRDLHRWLRDLEAWLIQGLALGQVEGGRLPGKTGVWLGAQKVASIGVAVRQWVTYHGVALNVSVDMRGFQGFDPCGMPSEMMTSLQAAYGDDHPAAAMSRVQSWMLQALGPSWQPMGLDELMKRL